MSRGKRVSNQEKRAVGLAKASGKTTVEIAEECKLDRFTVLRILKQDDTQAFIAALRAESGEQLHALYTAVIEGTMRDYLTCTDPFVRLGIAKFAMRLVEGRQDPRGGNRVSVNVDQRNMGQGSSLAPAANPTMKELIIIATQPVEEGKPN